MFEYKPLEKSAKKEHDFSGRGKIRKMLEPLDFIVVPIENGYEVIKPVPVIGPIISFIVKIFAVTGVIGLIFATVLILVAAAAIFGTWISNVAGPSAP